MVITAEEARKLTGNQLTYISEKIRAQALRGLHFIQFDYLLDSELITTLRELGFDIDEDICPIYESTPYGNTDKEIDKQERTTIRW